MLLADDRDLRQVSSWLGVSLQQSSFTFLLFVGFSVPGGSAAIYHDRYARWDDLTVSTHVDDNDHEFPVI
jgi:hypothetical protein